MEGERRDQQRHGEAYAGDRPAARDGGPAHRRAQPPAAQARREPRRPQHAQRLADDVADDDAQRDARAERACEEVAVEHDAGVREGEERHDHVARPGVVELLQALVRRDRRLEPDPGRARELRRRLLAEEPEEVARALEVAARGGIGEREQPHREPDHDRVDAGLREGVPGEHPEHGVDAAATDAERDCKHHDDGEEPDRRQQRHDVE